MVQENVPLLEMKVQHQHRSSFANSRPPTTLHSTDLVSIIVPCFGQVEYTRLFVPRLLRFSRNPIELIFTNVGSLDGTTDYLAGVASAASVQTEVLNVPSKTGCAAACSIGAARAQGDYIAFISNDALVSEGWLNHLIGLVKVAPDIGMVGCMSNFAPPPQWTGVLPYRLARKKNYPVGNIKNSRSEGFDLDVVDSFAGEWREKHRGQSFETDRLGGPCLVVKAELLKKIPLGDAIGPLGAIDGDLLSKWIRDSGFRLACVRDVFIHQFGSRPFIALRIDPRGVNTRDEGTKQQSQ